MAEQETKLKKSQLIDSKKKGKWFQKIPKNVILSPGGAILVLFAILIEGVDLIPIPFVDQLWEIPLELIFIALLTVIAKVPLKTSILPFLVERIPIVNDILPTWIIRMFA
jgi:hypothetical protein